MDKPAKSKVKDNSDDDLLFTQLKEVETSVKEDITDDGQNSSHSVETTKSSSSTSESPSLMWVDKHKPVSLKQIIGQHGDKSNANKLMHWIRKWHNNILVKGLKASGKL